MGISGDGGIVVVAIVTAVVSVVVLMSNNIFNCFCVCDGICSVVSDSGVDSACGGSSLAHHYHPN